MPANLTPQYQKAEEAYRRAQSAEEQVACLEEMLKLIPKHKGTEKLQADLKSRLKEAKAEAASDRAAPKKGRSFRFPSQGAGQVVIVGGPNAGKSRIVAELTNAEPAVADYPFATHEPVPGMMPWQDVKVQLIDTPPVTNTHIEPYLTNIVRSADACLLCLNGASDDAPDETAAVIEQLASRKTLLSDRTAFDEQDFSVVRVKTLLVVTRGDAPGCADRLEYFRELVGRPFETLRVELDREESREELRDAVYRMLNVIRVYTKAPGKPADYRDPFTIRHGGTVEELAERVHRELAATLKHARVWGESAHDGQTVGREHVLCDRDLVELHAS
ncbi:MAG: TGS domain-containing protein [Planctomycetes bacterium]|nr:TGS domain-containing protein [Planctomycetota bacterium]